MEIIDNQIIIKGRLAAFGNSELRYKPKLNEPETLCGFLDLRAAKGFHHNLPVMRLSEGFFGDETNREL